MDGNKGLRTLYDRVYEQGRESFHTFSVTEEADGVIEMGKDLWGGSRVLEVGCGEGDLASRIAGLGADVCAIDYSQSAIRTCCEKHALENLAFRCCSYEEIQERYDVVVMQGVLEHLDDPYGALEAIRRRNLSLGGCIITSSPSFLNPRGYIWMALAKLFNVPMSLSDLHFLCPFDFEGFAVGLGARLSYESVDQDWGHGEKLIIDFRKRLVNALRDAGMDNSNVDVFLDWLGKTTGFATYSQRTGANIVYRLQF